MVKKSKLRKTSALVILIILVALASIIATLLIWNAVFYPGVLVSYSKTDKIDSNASSGGGGGGKVSLVIIPQNATHGFNFTNST